MIELIDNKLEYSKLVTSSESRSIYFSLGNTKKLNSIITLNIFKQVNYELNV